MSARPEIICRPVADDAELRAALAIRQQVFVAEMDLFADSDLDADDRRATHLVAICQSRVIGTVRIFQDAEGVWWGGRLAVLPGHRGRAGRLLIKQAVAAVRAAGGSCFRARVLVENVSLFRALGWRAQGAPFEYRGRMHQLVDAPLQSRMRER